MTQATANVRLKTDLNRTSNLFGLGAAFITVLIWSGYFLSLRVGVLSPLSLIELSIIRYCFPGLLLLPAFIKAWPAYRATPWPYVLGILMGSGLLFFLLSAIAMKKTSVLMGSTLIPSAAPIFVTLIAFIVFKQKLSGHKKVGLAFVLTGIGVFLGTSIPTLNRSLLIGQGLLILSALVWALFTVSVRQSGLKPLQISALVTVPNGLIVLLWLLMTNPVVNIAKMPFHALATQFVVQGLLVGIFSGWFYAKAISNLGAEKTSAIGALTPIVASLIAFIFLQEALEFLPLLGLCFTSVGVLFASRHS